MVSQRNEGNVADFGALWWLNMQTHLSPLTLEKINLYSSNVFIKNIHTYTPNISKKMHTIKTILMLHDSKNAKTSKPALCLRHELKPCGLTAATEHVTFPLCLFLLALGKCNVFNNDI